MRASTLSRSDGVTRSVFSTSPRRTVASTGLPIGRRMTIWLKTGTSSANRTSTSWPASFKRTSPDAKPASADGEPSIVPPTSAPRVAWLDVRSGWISRPIHPRFTRPSRMIESATSRARSAGIAPARPRLISLMPTISTLQVHERSTGIAAEDGRVVADPPHDRADVLAVERHAVERPEHPRQDHLRVADDAHRDRLRAARAGCRGRGRGRRPSASMTSPNVATGNVRGVAGLRRIRRCPTGDRCPRARRGISSRLASVQLMARVRPATWWLVMTSPSAEMMVPLPDASRLSSRPSWYSTETTWMRTRLGATLARADWTSAVCSVGGAEDWAKAAPATLTTRTAASTLRMPRSYRVLNARGARALALANVGEAAP